MSAVDLSVRSGIPLPTYLVQTTIPNKWQFFLPSSLIGRSQRWSVVLGCGFWVTWAGMRNADGCVRHVWLGLVNCFRSLWFGLGNRYNMMLSAITLLLMAASMDTRSFWCLLA